jgi:hypothetical protein
MVLVVDRFAVETTCFQDTFCLLDTGGFDTVKANA